MNPSSPTVTVGIVFFNAGSYFKLAIESTLNQTFEDLELLLIDDGSTDGSLAIAREYEKKDPRVRVVSDGLNRKLNVRLNEAISLAKGRFFARMDADDVMMPWRIEHQVKLQIEHGPCFLGGAAISIDSQNNVRGYRSTRRKLETHWQARHMFIHPTVFAPTVLYRQYRYDEGFLFHRSQDAELWLRVWKSAKAVTDDRPVIFYRESDTINIENYLGTAFGIAALGLKIPGRPRIWRILWLGREFWKAWTICAIVLCGYGRVLIKARSKSLPEETKRYFGQLLASVCSETR